MVTPRTRTEVERETMVLANWKNWWIIALLNLVTCWRVPVTSVFDGLSNKEFSTCHLVTAGTASVFTLRWACLLRGWLEYMFPVHHWADMGKHVGETLLYLCPVNRWWNGSTLAYLTLSWVERYGTCVWLNFGARHPRGWMTWTIRKLRWSAYAGLEHTRISEHIESVMKYSLNDHITYRSYPCK